MPRRGVLSMIPCLFDVPEPKDAVDMKPEIHPQYHDIKVVCSCGNSFATRSTFEGDEIHVEVCSNCHPFYTGQQKIVDTAGQVDKFRRRYGAKK